MTFSVAALQNFAVEFQQQTNIKVRCDISARDYTTVAVGGNFAVLAEPQNEEELQKTMQFLKSNKIPWKILGAGSNLLVSDNGVAAWVIKLGRAFRYCKPDGAGRFLVGASMALMSLSRELSEQGYSGLEFAGGIPASIGGAVRMNAGAHGGQMSDILTEIRYIDGDCEMRAVKASDLTFSYRRCSLASDSLVVAALIELKRGDALAVAAKRAECLAERKSRQPLSMPSFGSVFKNPSGDATAGMLIERAGLKGERRGGAQISEMHANWIVNASRNASSVDVQDLMRTAQSKVQQLSGLTLEAEVVYWS